MKWPWCEDSHTRSLGRLFYALFQNNPRGFWWASPPVHSFQFLVVALLLCPISSKIFSHIFVECFCFLHFRLNFQLSCCYRLQTGPPFFFYRQPICSFAYQSIITFFELISTFCTQFYVFCTIFGIIWQLSTNQIADIFVCRWKILLTTMLTIKILFTINSLEKRKTIHSKLYLQFLSI